MFTPKFYNFISDSKQQITDCALDKNNTSIEEDIVVYIPELHGSSIEEFKMHYIFYQFKKQYENLIDSFYIFSEAHQLESLVNIKKNLDLFKKNIFSADFCDKNPGILWNSARESLEKIKELLKNHEIPLDKRKYYVKQLAEDITYCAEGSVSKIERIFSDLQLELSSSADFFQKKKEQIIQQLIINFVASKKKSWSREMEVHFVSAYFNAMADFFGLTQQHHEKTVLPNQLSRADKQECLQFLTGKMNAKNFIAQLANALTMDIETALSALIQDGKIASELLSEPMQRLDNILERANRRYQSTLTLHDFLIDKEGHGVYEIKQDQRMLRSIIAEGLQKHQLLKQEQPVAITEKLEGGDKIFSLFNQYFWLKKDKGERRALNEKELVSLLKYIVLSNDFNNRSIVSSIFEEFIEQTPCQSLSSKLEKLRKNSLVTILSIGENWQILNQIANQDEIIFYLSKHNLNTQDTVFNDKNSLYQFIDQCPGIALHINKMFFLDKENQRYQFTGSVVNQFFINMILNHYQQFSYSRFIVLMNAGADINNKDNQGRTLFSYLAQHNINCAKFLLSNFHAIDINSQDKKGNTPFMYAVLSKKEQSVKELLKLRNINVYAQNNEGKTALIMAKKIGGKILSLIGNNLLDNGIKNLSNEQDPVAKIIDLCSDLDDKWVADYFSKCFLSSKDATLMFKCVFPSEILLFNIFKGFPATFSTLQQKIWIDKKEGHQAPFDIGVVNRCWLHCMKGMDILEVLTALIEIGVDVNITNEGGKTALMYAAIYGNLEVIELLMKSANLNLNAVDNHDRNALMYAAQNNQQQVVQQLLECPEVNLRQVDKEGNNAYMLVPKHNGWLRDMIAVKSKAPAIEDTFEMVHAEDISEQVGFSALQQALPSMVNDDDFVLINRTDTGSPILSIQYGCNSR